MFTKNQLVYLVGVQSVEDWHCSGFVDALRNYHQNPSKLIIQLSQAEFNELMQTLSKASLDDIWNLQMALNFLNDLSCCLFTPEIAQT